MGEYVNYRFISDILDFLEENGKSESDIRWAGNEMYRIPWEELKSLLLDVCMELSPIYSTYDLVFPLDLLVVGDGFLMRMADYACDSSDPIWEYIPIPPMPQTTIHLQSLMLPKELRSHYNGYEKYNGRYHHTLEAQYLYEQTQEISPHP